SLSPASVETAADRPVAGQSALLTRESKVERLRHHFHHVRSFTDSLCVGLEPEDCVVQSMPDVSPTKWHLAHTTWFFEMFILKNFVAEYRAEIPEYAYLFNSYYNAAGDMHRRDLRGLISRPTVGEAQRYRASIDSRIDDLLSDAGANWPRWPWIRVRQRRAASSSVGSSIFARITPGNERRIYSVHRR